jgi:DNA polymerase sigma
VAVFRGNDNTRIINQSLRDHDVFENVFVLFLPPIGKGLIDFLEFFGSLSSLVIVIREFKFSLGDIG